VSLNRDGKHSREGREGEKSSSLRVLSSFQTSSSSSFGVRPRSNSRSLAIDSSLANALLESNMDGGPFSHSHSSSNQPFSRHLSSRIGNETPNLSLSPSSSSSITFTNGTHTPPINRYNIERKEYGLGLAIDHQPMFPPPPPLHHDHWANAPPQQTYNKQSWRSSLLGSISGNGSSGGLGRSRVWLKAPRISRGEKRRLSVSFVVE